MFSQGTVEVAWQKDAAGGERAWQVELLIGRTAIPVAQARDQAKPFHPPDGQTVRRYTAPAGQTVEVFKSDLLAESFKGAERPGTGGSFFGDELPGTYIQIAERGSPTTNRVVLALGNRP